MANEKRKPEDFVVTDRRKFTEEGERRPDAAPEAEDTAAITPPEMPSAPQPKPAEGAQVVREVASAADLAGVVPPSAAQQQDAQQAYARAGEEVDARLAADLGGVRPQELQITFEKLVTTLYMTAMLQLGILHEQGRQPRVDVLGARQTIDTLDLLREKTKGNLAAQESKFLEERLYELRMGYLEVLNAVLHAPEPPPPAPGEKK
ncbi:MAG TPA: DUF1844 domain-containing protein [Terriglobales bacterium]|nr:DUF1844 domain-containing protein [Terriglobales bacterium]